MVGEDKHPLDVLGATPEPAREVLWQRALGAPTQQSLLEWSEPRANERGAPSGQLGEVEDSFHERARPLEPRPDLGHTNTRCGETRHASFDGSEHLGVGHGLDCTGVLVHGRYR